MNEAEFTRLRTQLVAFNNQRDSLIHQIAAMRLAIEEETQRRFIASAPPFERSIEPVLIPVTDSDIRIGHIIVIKDGDDTHYQLVYAPATSLEVIGRTQSLESARLALQFWHKMRQSDTAAADLASRLQAERRTLEQLRGVASVLDEELYDATVYRRGSVQTLILALDQIGVW